ncbi:MAG TPA: sulfatase-like hydrolase/transferase, partial [Mycobacterium sp.]|uniref:sulfatase-like hydrolase/transferase n=1 Tax=Mycobacterium sp. TaxID=1785 RepID=UPI002B6E7BD6
MSEQRGVVLVAGYQDLDAARRDFDGLNARVKDKSIALRGAVMVGKDANGKPTLIDTGNHLGRRGVAWGAGVGLAVGLFSPALLASAAVGAAAGAVAGTFADHRLKSGLADKIGHALAEGTAVIIAVLPIESRLAVEQVLGGSPMKSIVELERSTLKGLETSLAEAMGKFNPDRTRLPLPDRTFGGTVGRTLDESVGDWTIVAGAKAPDDAPNVLIVLIDDAGFGGPETSGGAIHTPTLSRVAQNGLTYNRFHVTAVCSPTRAALLTGRNHHRVGFGSIAEYPGPFPGYTAAKPRSCAGLPRILRDNGYVTGGFGKWHLTPDNVQGAAGPFDHWPQAWGFDHFWGFLSGAAGQYDPIITQDNAVVGVPEGKDGKTYYFPDDLTDKAMEWLHAVRAQDGQKPWMMYYSTGCSHAPHHVPKEWADKYKGQFDDGWDVYRQNTLERQKKLGIVPGDTELTDRPELFPAWDSLSDTQKKLYIRQMEVFAGFSENA